LSRSPNAPETIELEAIAARAGEAWARERARELGLQRRAVAGAWPGTMTEARACVLSALAADAGGISIDLLRELSRTAYSAARAAWRTVAEPDHER
jgi:hypothetical protein